MPVEAGIHYLESGSGITGKTPLILVHGAAGSCQSWPATLRNLPGRRVITPDLPGHGSSGGVARQSIMEYAIALTGFIRDLGLPRVVLAGHSMGGAVSLQAAVLEPSVVQAVITISTSTGCNVPAEVIDQLLHPQLSARSIDWLCSRFGSPYTGQKRLELIKRSLLNLRGTILYNDLRTCLDVGLEQQLEEVRQPVLVCGGEHDQFILPFQTRSLAEKISGAKYELLDGGHLLPVEVPHRLAVLITEFLASRSL